ncbi:hypothetical protein J3458_000943 [Metarhizium acridum]|uniref:uncharacterized protein n=1 Tax=Metarhizium acridum TaxID=92637 RepID=UPI001C6BFCDF|nr:hypothetical protein J3458_000943 [Metarhizium acridum]
MFLPTCLSKANSQLDHQKARIHTERKNTPTNHLLSHDILGQEYAKGTSTKIAPPPPPPPPRLQMKRLDRREEMSGGIVAMVILVSCVVAVSLGAFAYYGCQRRPVGRRRCRVRLSSNSSGEFRRRRRRGDRSPDSGPAALDVLDPSTGDVTRPAAVQSRHQRR